MRELDQGPAKLTTLQGGDPFEVEYSITFITDLAVIRAGFPPVVKTSATVHYIRATDQRDIPAGEYLLHRESEINRLKNLGFGGWHVLSWPIG